MPNHLTRLTVIPNLLVEHGRIDRSMQDRETIADAMRAHGWTPDQIHARVCIDGKLIPQAQWEYAIPARGSSIVIRRVPMGGGGGGGKNTGMMIGMIAVMALALAAPYAAPLVAGTLFGMVTSSVITATSIALSAGVGIGGMLALRALIPPPLPRLTREIPDEKSLPISVSARRLHHPRGIARRAARIGRRTRPSDRSQLAR